MEKEDKELSDKKGLALELVLGGMKDGEIAKRVGVSRQRVNMWRNQDEDFRALLAERRKALRERHQDELSGLVCDAIGVMREAMREGEITTRLRAARAVLRMSGLQATMQKENPQSKEEIIREYLGEVIRKVGEKRGFYGTKQLPNEDVPAFHAP